LNETDNNVLSEHVEAERSLILRRGKLVVVCAQKSCGKNATSSEWQIGHKKGFPNWENPSHGRLAIVGVHSSSALSVTVPPFRSLLLLLFAFCSRAHSRMLSPHLIPPFLSSLSSSSFIHYRLVSTFPITLALGLNIG
jgi:hypothetical protein